MLNDEPRPHRLLRLISLCLVIIPGCAGTTERVLDWADHGWVSHYDNAERMALETGKPLLIAYRNARRGVKDNTCRMMNQPSLSGRVEPYVRCALMSDYEPDRRFVGQYGVDRAPAVILVHPDGTYHAIESNVTPESLAEFFDRAVPPGRPPRLNPYLAIRPRYFWIDDFATAHREAERLARPLFVVYDRAISRDWVDLREMLERIEVHRKTTDMIHCRQSLVLHLGESASTPFGQLRLPAIVILPVGGEPRVLERPVSAAALARFADSALGALPGPPEPDRESAAADSPAASSRQQQR